METRKRDPGRAAPAIVLSGAAVAFLAGVVLVAAPVATAQQVVSASPDIALSLGGASLAASDEDVAVDNRLGVVALESLGSLPVASDVTAFALDLAGRRLMAFDTTVELGGGLVVDRGDVAQYDGANYSIVFDASAAGVPQSAQTDAVSLAPTGLLLSFDTTVDLGGTVVAPQDLVRWDGVGFLLVFDGSTQGLESHMDIDAAQDLGGGSFLMSFDTTSVIGGVVFDDEDIVRFDGSLWTMEFDASSSDGAWGAADLDALFVPEPSFSVLVGVGVALLGLRSAQRTP